MLGAILGDIIGSVYERRNTTRSDFPLFSEGCRPTDDSVMTLAVARALMHTWGQDDEAIRKELIRQMQGLGRGYPHAGYGSSFRTWLREEDPQPYGSYGDGSAMRVSAVGWLYTTIEKTLHAAELTAEVSHNHPEGIRGAQAVAACIFLARAGKSKSEIARYVTDTFGYDLSRHVEQCRYEHFDSSCQGTVPQAIICFLERYDYESCVRAAISLGGDSDTLACMTGSIAEAYYGLPAELKQETLQRLNEDLRGIATSFHRFCEKTDRHIPDPPLTPETPVAGAERIQRGIADLHYGFTRGDQAGQSGVIALFLALGVAMRSNGVLLAPVQSVEGKPDQQRLHPLFDQENHAFVPLFTCRAELEKGKLHGRSDDFIPMSVTDCVQLSIRLEKSGVRGIILNPFGQSFRIDQKNLQLLEKLRKEGR